MDRFHIIQDAAAIVVNNSVFKQVPVYQRAGALYVGASGGFVRLYGSGNTGLANLRWDDIEIPGTSAAELTADSLNKLSLPPTFKQIEATRK